MLTLPNFLRAGLLLWLACLAQSRLTASEPETLLADLAKDGKYAFLLFYRDDSAATQTMDKTLGGELSRRRDQAGGARFAIADPAAKGLVQRLGIGRAPLPLTVAMAPNGAITGIFPKKLTPEQVDSAFVTRGMMESMKALQEKKLVLVCIAPSGGLAEWPAAAKAMQVDPLFKDRLSLVAIAADDQKEDRFLKEMELSADQVQQPLVALLAPPGVLVGKFSAQVPVAELAAKLHAAGKCCADPNCQHEKKGR